MGRRGGELRERERLERDLPSPPPVPGAEELL